MRSRADRPVGTAECPRFAGNNVLSFTMPWPLFLTMEQNVEGSFLQRRTWTELQRQ